MTKTSDGLERNNNDNFVFVRRYSLLWHIGVRLTKTEDKVKVCYRNTAKGNKDVESRWYKLVVSSVALKGACVNTEYLSVPSWVLVHNPSVWFD